MRVRIWGTRGSLASPGADTSRYGGNTSCVEVRGSDGTVLVLDAGTGIRPLGATIPLELHRVDVMLTHLHMDHIQGLGFFPPVFIGGNQFTVWGPGGSPEVLEQILEGQMDPNFSPLQSLKNFSATFDVRAAVPGDPFEAEGLTITAREHAHGSCNALAFKIQEGDRTFVYASDVGYPEDGGAPLEAIQFYRNADVLLHDTTYKPEDQATRRNRGFSSYEEAIDAAVRAKVKKLVMFHYDQDYSDDDVDGICKAAREMLDSKKDGKAIGLVPAREGDELEI